MEVERWGTKRVTNKNCWRGGHIPKVTETRRNQSQRGGPGVEGVCGNFIDVLYRGFHDEITARSQVYDADHNRFPSGITPKITPCPRT